MNITNLIGTPRVCAALTEWVVCATHIMALRRKQSGWKLYGALGDMLARLLFYQHLAGIMPLFLWTPGMLGVIFYMYLFIYFTYDVSWQDTGLCCVRVFVLAELAASLQWQLDVWTVIHLQLQSLILAAAIMLLVYLPPLTGYWLLEQEHISRDEDLNTTSRELSGAIIITLTASIISNLSSVIPDTLSSSVTSSILYARTLANFGGLVILVTQPEKQEELRMRDENQLMNVILQHQYDQHRMSVDNIELSRREFHDLKHYMVAIRAEGDSKKWDQYLEEMEQAITTQEALTNTDNRVLNVVLTTKSTYCSQKQTTLTRMTDGGLISFAHVKNICSTFGNAPDNAIECASQFDDPEKCLVTMSMFRKNQFLMT